MPNREIKIHKAITKSVSIKNSNMGTNDGKKKFQSSNPKDFQTTEDFHKAITKSVSIKKKKIQHIHIRSTLTKTWFNI